MSASVRLNSNMLALYASSSSDSSNASVVFGFWLTFITALVGLATLVLQYISGRFWRRFLYGVSLSARMLNLPMSRSNLHILWRNKEIDDPYILEISFVYKGGVDVSSSDFDRGRPIIVNVNIPIIDLLEVIVHNEGMPKPQVKAAGTTLKVGPDLLRKRQSLTFVLLVDGPCDHLECENPVANVVAKESRHRAQELQVLYSQTQKPVRRILTYGALLFVAFYLVTQPGSSGHLLNAGFRGLHSISMSLADFIHSLSF